MGRSAAGPARYGMRVRAEAQLTELEMAQLLADQHLLSDGASRCVVCGGQEPCPPRALAHSIFGAQRRMPCRTPGRTLELAAEARGWSVQLREIMGYGS
jgi:hypothetical protein